MPIVIDAAGHHHIEHEFDYDDVGDTKPIPAEAAKEPPPDPWEGVDPALRPRATVRDNMVHGYRPNLIHPGRMWPSWKF